MLMFFILPDRAALITESAITAVMLHPLARSVLRNGLPGVAGSRPPCFVSPSCFAGVEYLPFGRLPAHLSSTARGVLVSVIFPCLLATMNRASERWETTPDIFG
jgi:hypothetical protein